MRRKDWYDLMENIVAGGIRKPMDDGNIGKKYC
jgi:hypothetical protein